MQEQARIACALRHRAFHRFPCFGITAAANNAQARALIGRCPGGSRVPVPQGATHRYHARPGREIERERRADRWPRRCVSIPSHLSQPASSRPSARKASANADLVFRQWIFLTARRKHPVALVMLPAASNIASSAGAPLDSPSRNQQDDESSTLQSNVLLAEVIYTCDADFLPSEVPRLRWLQVNTAAVDKVLGKPIATAKIPIANVSGAYSVAVAECAIGMLLALTRRISLCPMAGQAGMAGRPLSILRRRFARKNDGDRRLRQYRPADRQACPSHGVRVLACKRNPHQKEDTTYRIPGTGDPDGQIPEAWFGTDQLALMLGRCDFAMITLPLTPATHGLVGKNELKALPPHAYVLNVGRGPLIDEAALVAALQAGKLAAAALDVFTVEPLPAESPLWKMPNVLVTPHIASWTNNQSDRAAEVLIENLSRDLNGQPLVNVIDRSAMY